MMNRRQILGTALAASAGIVGARSANAQAAGPTSMSRVTAYGFSFESLKGERISLAAHAGKPVLIVNTASQCGFTPQYTGLQQLWTQFRERGLMVIGVPSNDFGGQEPGGATEIAQTTDSTYHITFPIAAKTVVKGPNAHPFYKWAAQERPIDLPGWNFHKYLIGRDGYIAEVFSTRVDPADTRIVTAIARQLTA